MFPAIFLCRRPDRQPSEQSRGFALPSTVPSPARISMNVSNRRKLDKKSCRPLQYVSNVRVVAQFFCLKTVAKRGGLEENNQGELGGNMERYDCETRLRLRATETGARGNVFAA